LHLWSPPLRLTSTRGRTDISEIQGLSSSWDNILIPAKDATQRLGAATTWREADLGARGVTKINTGTRTSKHQDSDPHAQKQPTRRHKRCKPDGLEHGDIAHHLHPWQAQPADTIAPYDPCNSTTAAVTARLDKKFMVTTRIPDPACTIPSLWRRTRASPLGSQT